MLHFIHTFIKRINKEYEELQYNGRKQKRSTSQCPGVSANQKPKAKCRQSGVQTSYPPANQDQIHHTSAPIHLL